MVAHGDAREGKWRGNWRMEWVASTLTRPRDVVYPSLLTLMRTPRLPAVDWTDSPADLNGLVRLGGRGKLVSARVPSGSARALPVISLCCLTYQQYNSNIPLCKGWYNQKGYVTLQYVQDTWIQIFRIPALSDSPGEQLRTHSGSRNPEAFKPDK